MKRTPMLPDNLSRPNTAPNSEPAGTSRGWLIAAIVLSLLAAASLGVVGWLLFAPGEDTSKQSASSTVIACVPDRDFRKDANGKKCPPKNATMTEGIVGKDSTGGFDMTTLDGRSLQLTVREADRPYIDVAHAQTHAALGQPVRVYERTYKGQKVVVYMEDAPLAL